MAIIVVLIIFFIIAYAQIGNLIRNKEWKELFTFIFFYLIGLTLTILYVSDVDMPSPI